MKRSLLFQLCAGAATIIPLIIVRVAMECGVPLGWTLALMVASGVAVIAAFLRFARPDPPRRATPRRSSGWLLFALVVAGTAATIGLCTWLMTANVVSLRLSELQWRLLIVGALLLPVGLFALGAWTARVRRS